MVLVCGLLPVNSLISGSCAMSICVSTVWLAQSLRPDRDVPCVWWAVHCRINSLAVKVWDFDLHTPMYSLFPLGVSCRDKFCFYGAGTLR